MSVALPKSRVRLLVAGFQQLRRRYRKKLARCQRKFSEAAVHDLRIETRRLLAMLDLLRALHFDVEARKPRKTLKRRLDSFDDLRDTHVCLALLKPLWHEFPEARALDPLWRRRERRLTSRLRRRIQATKQVRLQKRLKVLQKALQGEVSKARGSAGLALAQTALREAFAQTVELRQRIRGRDPRTIHRTRIAFKRFRYLCELLRPLLPGLTPDQLVRMRKFQSLMGDIQDVEVLLIAVAAALEDQEIPRQLGWRLRVLLRHRRRNLIERFLASADELFSFDPAGLTQPRPPSQASLL